MVAGITPPTVGGKIAAGGAVGQLQTYVTGLVHGEWTYAVSVGNNTGSITPLAAGSAVVTARSSSNISTAVGTTASGFTAIVAGVYNVSLQAKLPAIATGRSWCSILSNATADEFRSGTSTDDRMSACFEFYMAAGDTVAFQFYQTTGGTQTLTGRFNISYRGGL